MLTHIYTQLQPHLWRGAQKFPVRKAGRRNTGNNWVSEKSLGPSQSHFPILGHCLLSCCCVRCFTGDRNNSPSGSPSSFVDKKWVGIILSQDGSVVDTQREMALIYLYALIFGHYFKTWALWSLFCVTGFWNKIFFLIAIKKQLIDKVVEIN